ncbi:MAG: hypothetical protein AB2L09_03600 [Coriobacteriia bacterium]
MGNMRNKYQNKSIVDLFAELNCSACSPLEELDRSFIDLALAQEGDIHHLCNAYQVVADRIARSDKIRMEKKIKTRSLVFRFTTVFAILGSLAIALAFAIPKAIQMRQSTQEAMAARQAAAAKVEAKNRSLEALSGEWVNTEGRSIFFNEKNLRLAPIDTCSGDYRYATVVLLSPEKMVITDRESGVETGLVFSVSGTLLTISSTDDQSSLGSLLSGDWVRQ